MDYVNKVMGYFPPNMIDTLYTVCVAFIILIVGWLVAKFVSALLEKAVMKIDIIGRALKIIGVHADIKQIASFVGTALPQYIGVAALAGFTWLAAVAGRTISTNVLATTQLDKKAGQGTGAALGSAVYGFVILFFLPGILGGLGLKEIVTPVQGMLSQMIGYVPNLIGAGIILAVGVFVARLMKQIVTSILSASKIDDFAARVGMKDLSFSNIGGTIVYVFIMIPLAISALEKLQIDAISAPATEMLGKVLDILPNIIGAIALVTLTYLVASFVARLGEDLLKNLGFDSILEKVGLKISTSTSLSTIVSKVVLVVFMLFAFVEAGNMIGLTIVSDMVTEFISFGSSIIGGIITIIVGLFIANLVSDTMHATNQSKTVTNFVKILIIILAISIGLGQMGIAQDIIKIAFGLFFGSIAVAAAVAFGLGSREIAAKELEGFLTKMKK